jgi:hypothetical protein
MVYGISCKIGGGCFGFENRTAILTASARVAATYYTWFVTALPYMKSPGFARRGR